MLSYLEIVCSFWSLLLIFVRPDQGGLFSRANFAHYWADALLSPLLGAPWMHSFSFFSGRNTNYYWPEVSCRGCSLFSLQVVLLAAGTVSSQTHWAVPSRRSAGTLVLRAALLSRICLCDFSVVQPEWIPTLPGTGLHLVPLVALRAPSRQWAETPVCFRLSEMTALCCLLSMSENHCFKYCV